LLFLLLEVLCFLSVHDLGQAWQHARLRRCGAGPAGQVQNLLSKVHLSPRAASPYSTTNVAQTLASAAPRNLW
jgi:hypothetical protein